MQEQARLKIKTRSNPLEKECPHCKTSKVLSLFHKKTESIEGLSYLCKECHNKRNRCTTNARRQAYRLQIFDKLGHQCKHCGFADKRALQIDHVFGGSKHGKLDGIDIALYKKVLADTTGRFQILCANCNWIKRYTNHELKKGIPN